MVKMFLGVDLGNDTLKFSFAAENRKGVFYGRAAKSIFDFSCAARGYYDTEDAEWTFGNEIERVDIDKFETIVEIKKLLSMLNSDYGSAAYSKTHTFEKFGQEMVRKYNPKAKSTFDIPGETPRSVVGRFFDYALKTYLPPIVEQITRDFGCEWDKECVVTYPYDADDRYKQELLKIFEGRGLRVIRMLPEPVAAALYAYHLAPAALEGTRALVVDIGATRMSSATVEFSKSGGIVTKAFYPSHGIGGNDFDKKLVAYARKESGDDEEISFMQAYIQDTRAKYAKECLFFDWDDEEEVSIECVGAVTTHIPITEEIFDDCTKSAVNVIADAVKDVLRREKKLGAVILTGGCNQIRAITAAIRERAGSDVPIVELRENIAAMPDKYRVAGSEKVFAVSLGAALLSTETYKGKVKLVSPLSYGIRCYPSSTSSREEMSTVVAKNTPLPLHVVEQFSTHTTTTGVEIAVLSSRETGQHIPLEKTSTVLSKPMKFDRTVPAGHEISIHFDIDDSGVCLVNATSARARTITSHFSMK